MGEKSDEYRAQARRLEERAETVTSEAIRLTLISVAQRWRDLAQEVERYEMNSVAPPAGLERQNRKATIAALSRAARAYWEHEKARPVPDRLAKVTAPADEGDLTQVKDGTDKCK
jgi:hypothetical protein